MLDLLNEIVSVIPAPVGDAEAPARALIFDSVYDTYRGVVTYVRVIDGSLHQRERIAMMSTGSAHEAPLEVGVISPEPVASDALGVGEVGYLITGVSGCAPIARRGHDHGRGTRRRRGARGLPGPAADGLPAFSRSMDPTFRSCGTRSTS